MMDFENASTPYMAVTTGATPDLLAFHHAISRSECCHKLEDSLRCFTVELEVHPYLLHCLC